MLKTDAKKRPRAALYTNKRFSEGHGSREPWRGRWIGWLGEGMRGGFTGARGCGDLENWARVELGHDGMKEQPIGSWWPTAQAGASRTAALAWDGRTEWWTR